MTTTHTLIRSVRAAAERAGFVLDDAQEAALQALATTLLGNDPDARVNLYLHGPAGRGKTWLVDAVATALPPERVSRRHLHSLMAELHPAVFQLSMMADPDAVPHALTAVLGEADIVILDEFHTHDAGDARLLTRMLRSWLEAGVRVVLTSNYPPDRVMSDSPWQHTMAAAIALLSEHYDVISVAGPVDYRTIGAATSEGFTSGTWRVAEPAPERATTTITTAGREFPVTAADTTLRATFAQLCEAPTAPSDFVSWAAQWNHVELTAVPLLTSVSPSAQQRFVTLVDVLADANIRLDIVSRHTRARFAEASGARPDVFRTVSRLQLLTEQ